MKLGGNGISPHSIGILEWWVVKIGQLDIHCSSVAKPRVHCHELPKQQRSRASLGVDVPNNRGVTLKWKVDCLEHSAKGSN